jgi:hypothetical protein
MEIEYFLYCKSCPFNLQEMSRYISLNSSPLTGLSCQSQVNFYRINQPDQRITHDNRREEAGRC